jgi:HK97 family phage major capsid protein
MNLDALKRDLATKQAAARAKFAAVTSAAHDEDRVLTDDEKASVQALVDGATALKAQVDRAESDLAIGRTIESLVPVQVQQPVVPGRPNGTGAPATPARPQSLGEQFVTHANYDFFKNGGHRSASAWRSPSTELFAATLTTDPASGGKLIVPDYRPGILAQQFRRLVVADLLASGTTDSNLITYMVEKAFVNAADTVAEGAVKPESTLTFDAASDPVRKIAHWLPVTEEMLEDVAQIRSYIDSRLQLGIQLTEEDQLLNGSLVAPDIIGIRNRTGLAADVPVGVAPATGADAIFKQMMAIYNTALVMPDGIVMNPANWQSIQLLKTSTGEYMGGGPFQSPVTATLWGLPVVVTPAIEAGTALVGAFGTAAQVFRKGGIRVEASNSHQDFFIKNLVAIRAEERLALAVYRPGAFGEVTGLV